MLAKKHQITIGLIILIQCLFVFTAKAQKSFVYRGLWDGDSYGIKQINKPNYLDDTVCIIPPIYNSIGNFNKFGLARIARSAPFFSHINLNVPYYYHASDDSIIINYWTLLYPDSSFNSYKVVGSILDKERYHFDFLVCDRKNNVLNYHNIYDLSLEDMLGYRHKNYVDQWGNFYPNVFKYERENIFNGKEHIYFHYQIGIINENGKVVLPLIYDYVGLKENDTLGINQNPIYPIVYRNKLGFIDSTGKVIIEPKFENNIHSEGVKDMTEGERFEINRFFNGICTVKENNKFGIIDTTGKVIIPIIYEHIYYEFTNEHDIPYEHIHYITAQDNLGNSFKYDLKGNLINNK